MAQLHSHSHISWRLLFKTHRVSGGPDDYFTHRGRKDTTLGDDKASFDSTSVSDESASAVSLGPMSPQQPSVALSAESTRDRWTSTHQNEDDVLRSVASAAMKQSTSISSNTFVAGKWKQRRSRTNDLVLEHRSHNEYRIIAKSIVPCTLDEMSAVLSSSNSDYFNASMVELLGHQFAFSLTTRSVQPPAVLDATATLVLRHVTFSDSTSGSAATDGNFLDFTERNAALNCERRAVQSIIRSSSDCKGNVEIRTGNALCGYTLHEDPDTKHTVVLLYGTYSSCESESRSHRHTAIHRYHKLVQISTKWVDIVMRRRLGAQPILDPHTDASRSVLELSCVGCGGDFHPLFRKRHFCSLCGAHACASCSSVSNAELDFGKIRKLRVCHSCVTDVNERALRRRSRESESDCGRDTLDCAFDDLLLECAPDKLRLL